MRYVGSFFVVGLVIAFAACGDNSATKTNPGTGVWSTTLITSTNQTLGSFPFNMTQNGTTLTASNMNFSSMPAAFDDCFGAGTVMSGQMGAGMMNGGTMTMTMSFTPPGSNLTNTLVMQGSMGLGMLSGSGTFTLAGQTPGCTSQTGTFTMTHTAMSPI